MKINKHGMGNSPSHHKTRRHHQMMNANYGYFNQEIPSGHCKRSGSSIFPNVLVLGMGVLFGYGLVSLLSNLSKQSTQPKPSQYESNNNSPSISVPQGAKTPASVTEEKNYGKEFNVWQQKVEQNKTIEDFSFLGDDYSKAIQANDGEKVKSIYKDSILKFSQQSIDIADKDKDGGINYSEFLQKENYNDDEMAKRTFRATDLNNNGQIDTEEQASMYAFMDGFSPLKANGKISRTGYTDFNNNFTDDALASETKKKFGEFHQSIFGA